MAGSKCGGNQRESKPANCELRIAMAMAMAAALLLLLLLLLANASAEEWPGPRPACPLEPEPEPGPASKLSKVISLPFSGIAAVSYENEVVLRDCKFSR